jgi:arsenite oxidase small subunit
MTSENTEPKDGSDESRRNLLKIGVGLGAILVVGGVGAVAKTLINPGAQPVESAPTTQTTTGTSSGSATQTASVSSSASLPPPADPGFPVIMVANSNNLTVGTTVSFNYPLEETPNVLVKLGIKAAGGVGPDGDIVAFSQICQHLGCIYGFVDADSSPSCDSSYKATGPVGYCCCHGSVYDLVNGAKVIGGPAPRPVPQVILNYDSSTGNIYATGMTPPTIFGYDTGSNNVSDDLQNGTLVS